LPTDVTTVVELLQARAEHQPDRVGYVFLADGETDEHPLTYGRADARARAVAASLRAASAVPGDRVLLVLPPGLDYITALFGCLYAGVVAVPVYPPDPVNLDRALPRLTAIVRDAEPVAALTIAPLLGFLDVVTERAPALGGLRWLAVDEADGADDPHDARGLVPVKPDTTALLQYTSGSTAAPKGVLLSHGNLLHNSSVIERLFDTTPESRGLVWLPPYHDMGLIGGLIQPLYAGFPVTLMSPLHFLEDPLRWLRAIDRHRITASGGPNFAYQVCVRRADPEQVATLDLSSWRLAFNGAEPIRPETLVRFAETFAPAGFRPEAFLPCYGLAEATLIVSGRRPLAEVHVDRTALEQHRVVRSDDATAVRLANCGPGVDGQLIAIIDPATSVACPDDRVGEIWVSGPSVAQGYWRRPEDTDRVFHARIDGGDERAFLRTGDLGFRLDGQLVVTGRLKDLLIVRGQNHYPQDIELTAERADPVLRPGGAAAFVLNDNDDEIVLVHEVRRQADVVDVDGVAGRIRQAVAQAHGLQVHVVALIRPGGLPKTPSGKVQRRLCRARFLAAELPEIGRSAATPPVPGTPLDGRAGRLEDYLRTQIAAVGGIGPLDRHQALLAAGLDSLAVLQLKHSVESDLALQLPVAAILAGASLADLVDRLVDQIGATPIGQPGRAGPQDGAGAEVVAPVTHGQRWMWLMQQFEPERTTYNIAMALRALSPVDGAALRRALDTIVSRHPILRTTFPVLGGEPVMLVRPDGVAAYRTHDAGSLDAATLQRRLASAAREPFSLQSGPLLRVHRYRRPDGDVLLLSMHHIITDFWSMTVLARELGDCYTAYAEGRDPVLATPAATYLDVVERERAVLGDKALAGRLAAYWDEQVGDGVPALALPASGDGRSAVPSPGGSRSFRLPAALTQRLRERAAAERVTLFVLLLAAFQDLLHRYTGQDDLTVGTNVAGRTRPEFAEVVGFCTKPVMIRSRAASFPALLERTRDQVIGALEHQEYPTNLLAERHRIARRGGTLFDVLFTFNRSPERGTDLAGLAGVGPSGMRHALGSLQVEIVSLPDEESGAALELVIAEVGGELYGALRHRAGALGEPEADRLMEQFITELEVVGGQVPSAA
jgi:acyl-CoA synthetase (AMP-forming)/AMP-acid ligase II